MKVQRSQLPQSCQKTQLVLLQEQVKAQSHKVTANLTNLTVSNHYMNGYFDLICHMNVKGGNQQLFHQA